MPKQRVTIHNTCVWCYKLIVKAWLSVKKKKPPFLLPFKTIRKANEEDKEDILLSEWLQENHLESNFLHNKNEINDYAESDKNLIISEYPTDEDIAAFISNKDLLSNEESDGDNVESDPMPKVM